jgi:calcium permeable stress-gated cation channel
VGIGFVLYMVCRECIFFINLRQAYLLSPYYARRISSRTVLFASVPQQYLDERQIRKVFGPAVRYVWIPRNTDDLWNLVEEREQTATRLERAEIKLTKMANAQRQKMGYFGPAAVSTKADEPKEDQVQEQEQEQERGREQGQGQVKMEEEAEQRETSRTASTSSARKDVVVPVITPASPSSTSSGAEPVSPLSPSSSTVFPRPSSSSSPTPRLTSSLPGRERELPGVTNISADSDPEKGNDPYGLGISLPDVNGSVAAQWVPVSERPHHRPLANFGRRVDTIKWTRQRIKLLNQQIHKARKGYYAGDGRPINAAFIEFRSQADAQSAYQTLSHHRPLHMSPRFIGIRPHDIVWSSLRMKWWERIMRRFAMTALITAAIIFWSIPSAIVGSVSNLTNLAKTFPFLDWLNQLPRPLTSIITGLVPAIVLSLFMAFVPVMLRGSCLARLSSLATSSFMSMP